MSRQSFAWPRQIKAIVGLGLVVLPLHVASTKDAAPRQLQSTCQGFDEEWDHCPNLPPCNECKPINCEFAAWGDWFIEFSTCSGLLTRQRAVAVSNNECGKPCSGNKVESKENLLPECVAKSDDCELSAWGEWTACATPTGQSFRERTIDKKPENGGKACSGHLKETRPCSVGPPVVDCEFAEWQAWSECTVTCGTGRHTRMRSILKEPKNGGSTCKGMLTQSQVCDKAACPSQDCKVNAWSQWTPCEPKDHPQSYRSRHVEVNAFGDGKRCNNVLKETKGCLVKPPEGPTPCKFSPWSEWKECDVTCDGGQTFRFRKLSQPGNEGKCDAVPLKETAPCGTQPCKVAKPGDCKTSEWTSWSECSSNCGHGSRSRFRNITTEAKEGGQSCDGPLAEISTCTGKSCTTADCQWSQWFDWSACSCSCDGGTKRRSRVVASPPLGTGKLCDPLVKSEVVPCNTQSCAAPCVDGQWEEWQDWSKCTATCDSGIRQRARGIASQPNYCGKPLVGLAEEYNSCSSETPCIPPQDCLVSEWGEWTTCSCTCFGIRERDRFIQQFAAGTGKMCDDMSLKEVEPCNPGPGGKVSLGCEPFPKVDCVLSRWGEWSTCTKECGGGQQTRSREVITEPANGGHMCDNDLSVTRPCQTQPCEKTKCIDCQWGEWSMWGACSKCGGERYRHRAIARLPNHCGRMCELKSSKEVSNCTSHCVGTFFCTWAEWSSGIGCGSCGASSSSLRNRGLVMTKKPTADFLFESHARTQCSGTQLDFQTCPNAKSCEPKCVPKDCTFGVWSDWTGASCTGLCERNRVVDAMNNECGQPCAGPLIETKRCKTECQKPVDCMLSGWTAWDASSCTKEGGQKERKRTLEQMPAMGGKECAGPMVETSGCSYTTEPVIPCKVSGWTAWGQCEKPCGGGWQTRSRQIVQKSSGGGIPCTDSLKELQMCNTAPCKKTGVVDCKLSDWETWSECGGGCGGPNQRDRKRQIIQLAEGGGASCTGHLEETKTCGMHKKDCAMSAWTQWEACPKTCGGAQQSRHREVQTFPVNGGKPCPVALTETQGCGTAPCGSHDCKVGQWSEWGACSATCGTGQLARTRKVINERSEHGVGCTMLLAETKPCEHTNSISACHATDCEWGLWSDWSHCTCECGGGQKTRDRHIATSPEAGGKACKPEDSSEIAACNTQPCEEVVCQDGTWGLWTLWSPCSATCGGGVTFRTRKVDKMATECGKPASGFDRETKFCNADIPCEAPIDCGFGEWNDWGDCTMSCNGIRERSRRIGRFGRGNGTYCIGALKETHPCSAGIGEPMPAGCLPAKPKDCKMSLWSDWSSCPVTCDGGQQERTRQIAVLPANGGKACEGPTHEIMECNRQGCPGPEAVDCQFGEWQDWEACGKCGGERKRFRSIEQFPSAGGANCEPFAHEEIGWCKRKCHTKLYCVWTTWASWMDCTATCGLGKRSRRRYLTLSETKGDPPAPVTMQKYAALWSRTENLEASDSRDIIFAFACGCLTFAVAFVSVRFFTASRSAPRSSGEASERSRPLYRHPQDFSETELPVVGSGRQ